jgi:hypothetical protein
MEVLGGVGYLENEDIEFNIARLYRDANVISIWEGTTNVLADDTIRALKSPKDGLPIVHALGTWLNNTIQDWNGELWSDLGGSLLQIWADMERTIREKTAEELRVSGRELMWDLSWVVAAVLLGEDARRDGDPIAREVCQRWFRKKSARSKVLRERRMDWRDNVKWDMRVVYGDNCGEFPARL